MLISMNWIQDYVDLSGLDIEGLIKRFTLSTAEVEEIIPKGRDTYGVIVAKIASVENHPDSKKLHLLKIDTGSGIVDCVCGAPNVREGMKVAFATDGGCVCGNEIRTATVGGYTSQGMCCSEYELGISADKAGLMEITDDIALGTDLKAAYAVDDMIFEVDNKSLTNRPDLWGHYGIAREFAALTGRELKPVPQFDAASVDTLPDVDIDIIDRELAYRYTSVIAENVTERRSPVNMRIRLHYCGLRAINLLADLTNYVMLDLGQPMHAFDYAKVDKIEVKRFDAPIEFETLDGVKRTVDENTLMICSHGEPVAVAGIMGGLASEIEDDTTSLLLESANFDGVSVRKSSTRLGLRTDASMRYEKMLDPELTPVAAGRYLKLLTAIDPGARIVSRVTDVCVKSFPEITLEFDKAFVDRYTGIEITDERIVDTLLSLGFEVDYAAGHFKVGVPSWRRTKDVTIKADIIEEITRIYGYDNFEITTTSSPLRTVRSSAARTDSYTIKTLLADKFGWHEVNSYIWCDSRKFADIGVEIENNVKLVNSLSTDLTVLRNSMIPTLLTMANENKLFSESFGIFEIARVCEGLDGNGLCRERKKLGIVLFDRAHSEEDAFFTVKNALDSIVEVTRNDAFKYERVEPQHAWQHPVNLAAITLGGKRLGYFGVVHPSVRKRIDKKAALIFAELDMDDFSGISPKQMEFEEPSKFPGVRFDLSFVADRKVLFGTFEDIIKAENCENLTDYSLLGTYTDDTMGDNKSVTIRLNFGSHDRTLSIEEVQKTVDALIARFDAEGFKLKV